MLLIGNNVNTPLVELYDKVLELFKVRSVPETCKSIHVPPLNVTSEPVEEFNV